MKTRAPMQIGKTFTCLMLLIVLALTANRSAHAIDPVRMGFVDMPRLMEASGIAERSDAEARQVVSDARAKLETEQQAIVKMQEDYKRDEAILSESQRSAQQQAIQSRMQAYQQMAVDLQKDINQKKLQFTRDALQPVQKVITDIAGEEGLNAIFDRSANALLFVDDSIDLTDRVIERLKAGGK